MLYKFTFNDPSVYLSYDSCEDLCLIAKAIDLAEYFFWSKTPLENEPCLKNIIINGKFGGNPKGKGRTGFIEEHLGRTNLT